MIQFFDAGNGKIFAVGTQSQIIDDDLPKLEWLFGNASKIEANELKGFFIGPRREMITPWSTNAVEITQNMGISGIERIEEFEQVESEKCAYDPMLQVLYKTLNQDQYNIEIEPKKFST